MPWPLSAFADEIDPSLDIQLEELRKHGVSQIDLRSIEGVNVLSLNAPEITEAF